MTIQAVVEGYMCAFSLSFLRMIVVRSGPGCTVGQPFQQTSEPKLARSGRWSAYRCGFFSSWTNYVFIHVDLARIIQGVRALFPSPYHDGQSKTALIFISIVYQLRLSFNPNREVRTGSNQQLLSDLLHR